MDAKRVKPLHVRFHPGSGYLAGLLFLVDLKTDLSGGDLAQRGHHQTIVLRVNQRMSPLVELLDPLLGQHDQ